MDLIKPERRIESRQPGQKKADADAGK